MNASTDKQRILNEIRQTAEANGGVPLGVARFLQETGIKATDWAGKFWVRWGDALREANSDEVQELRQENERLKQLVADLSVANMVLKKSQY